MFGRFDIRPVLRGHWKGLANGQYINYRPDWAARIILLLPLLLFTAMWVGDGRLAAPTPLLSAAALLAGGMLSAFTHLSNLRLKITEWAGDGGPDRFAVEREMLDESAAHLLTGSLICVLDAATLVVGMNISVSDKGQLIGFWAALASGLSAYVFLIFIITIPRLYSAWVEINGVARHLNGFAKGRR
jgi:hypothetical protein